METQKQAVKDWGKAIVPEQHKEGLESLLKEAKDFANGWESRWKLVGNSGGFKYFAPSSTSDVKVLSCYAEGTLECSAQVAFELLNNENLIKELDDNVDYVKVLERDHHNRFTHVTMKGMYWTAPREVVTLDHWFVENGTIYKLGFSVEHQGAPIHPDPSVKVRALSRGWTIIVPDPNHNNKCKLQMQVDIDVRLEHVPKTVQRLLAGSAQKVNAQNFGSNLKQVNQKARRIQRQKPSSHLVVNHGGVVSEIATQQANSSAPTPADEELDFSDLKPLDIAMTLGILLASTAAVLSNLYLPAAA